MMSVSATGGCCGVVYVLRNRLTAEKSQHFFFFSLSFPFLSFPLPAAANFICSVETAIIDRDYGVN